MKRRHITACLTGLALLAGLQATPALAAWPDKPITVVVPYAPGGTADALARLISQHLSSSFYRQKRDQSQPVKLHWCPPVLTERLELIA